MEHKTHHLQELVNAAHAPHSPSSPAPNPGAGLIAEGMQPVGVDGTALAHDRGSHDHKGTK